MAKVKTTFFCQNCGAQSPKWIGKCPACGEWNTYVEEIIQKEEPEKGAGNRKGPTKKASAPKKLMKSTTRNSLAGLLPTRNWIVCWVEELSRVPWY